MSDESTGTIETGEGRGLSRRAALKAGVAVGVGTAVWSGVSITSLGGTPAYAAGCTFVERIPLISEPCRNVDLQSTCGSGFQVFAFHTLDATLPAGFFIDQNIGNAGTCCPVSGPTAPIFRWDSSHPNIECTVATVFFDKNCKASGVIYETFVNPVTKGDATGGQLSITLPCSKVPNTPFQNTFYSIQAFCAPIDAPPGCVQNPFPPG